MAQPRKKAPIDGQSTKEAPIYDSSLKMLFGGDAAEILPILLPGTEFLHDHNIEIDRSQLRADLVYNILYKGLQTDEDKEMHFRLLQYHVNLHAKYKKPVISVVLYPFEENIPVPPYEEMSVEEALYIGRFCEDVSPRVATRGGWESWRGVLRLSRWGLIANSTATSARPPHPPHAAPCRYAKREPSQETYPCKGGGSAHLEILGHWTLQPGGGTFPAQANLLHV